MMFEKIKMFEDNALDITNVATTTTLNAKINEVKNKIPNITNIANNSALTAVENKIPDYIKYITTPEITINSRKLYCKIKTSKFRK